jgi:hypothetical protein
MGQPAVATLNGRRDLFYINSSAYLLLTVLCINPFRWPIAERIVYFWADIGSNRVRCHADTGKLMNPFWVFSHDGNEDGSLSCYLCYLLLVNDPFNWAIDIYDLLHRHRVPAPNWLLDLDDSGNFDILDLFDSPWHFQSYILHYRIRDGFLNLLDDLFYKCYRNLNLHNFLDRNLYIVDYMPEFRNLRYVHLLPISPAVLALSRLKRAGIDSKVRSFSPIRWLAIRVKSDHRASLSHR